MALRVQACASVHTAGTEHFVPCEEPSVLPCPCPTPLLPPCSLGIPRGPGLGRGWSWGLNLGLSCGWRGPLSCPAACWGLHWQAAVLGLEPRGSMWDGVPQAAASWPGPCPPCQWTWLSVGFHVLGACVRHAAWGPLRVASPCHMMSSGFIRVVACRLHPLSRLSAVVLCPPGTSRWTFGSRPPSGSGT